MTPFTLSRFWQRRVYEAAFLLSFIIIGLWVIPQYTTIPATGIFSVSLPAFIGAVITAIGSIILYFVKATKTYYPSLLLFTVFTATTALLVWQTGGTASPFLGFWMLIAFCSGIFNGWGITFVFVATSLYLGVNYLAGALNAEELTLVLVTSLIPAVASTFVWRHQDAVDESTKHVKHLTTQLSEVANRSEIVINAIGDGVVAIDSLGVIQLINPAAQEILGWGKQDALALNYKSIVKMLDAENHEIDPSQDVIDQVLNTNQMARTSAVTLQTRSGKKIVTSMVVSPIGDAGSGVIAVFRDVTKEKAEEHGQAEFISTASHEMRTPVASIEGYLGLALNPSTAQVDEKARGFIIKAQEAAQHLGRLFQDLLDVSRSEDGRLTNTPKVVNVATFVEGVVEGLRPKAQEKGLILTYAPSNQGTHRTLAPVYYVNLDNDHIREVVNNLVENAIKYTPAGEVVVDITGDDDKIILSVKDSGLGIPAEDVPHLFQKFYRVDNNDRQAIGGTGLGLYLSRRLAESMQGSLSVESTHGKGSTFFLELPRISSEQAAQLSQQQTANAQQTIVTPAAGAAFTQSVEQVQQQAYPQQPASQPAQVQQSPTPSQQSLQQQPVQVAPATTVPRGDSLTREQIAERVRQLEALARETKAEREAPPQAPRQ